MFFRAIAVMSFKLIAYYIQDVYVMEWEEEMLPLTRC